MPSVYFRDSSAVATEQVVSGSAGRPHTIMGWVKLVGGGGRLNNPVIGSFRVAGGDNESEGNVGYVPSGPGSSGTGRGIVVLTIVNWANNTRATINFPDVTSWYYVVLQVGSGSNSVVNLKLFADDTGLTKVIDRTYSGYPFMTTPSRYFGISGGSIDASYNSIGTKFTYLRTFVSGTFTDTECREQAVSRTPASHPSAVLWDAWSLTTTNFTGEVNGRTLNVVSASVADAPRADPDQPFTFIRSDIATTVPVSGSTTFISDAGRNSFVIR
jgi:hypothetical protein